MKITYRRPLYAALTALVIALALAACGGGGGSKTVTTTTVKSKTSTTNADDGKQPNGVLTTSAIGSIKVGSTQKDVVAAFGAPDKKDTSDPEAVVWQWQMKNGLVKIRFADGKVRSYFTDSTLLETKSGFHVGDQIKKVTESVNLQQSGTAKGVIGEEVYTLSEGSAGTYPALAFEVTKGIVVAISGGDDWSGSQPPTNTTVQTQVTTTAPVTTTALAPTTTAVPTAPATTAPVQTGDNGGTGFGQ